MDGPLSVSDMQDNVARSKVHVVKQEAIIARLTSQGHDEMASSAKAVLVTMRDHLAIEIEMLANMEAKQKNFI